MTEKKHQELKTDLDLIADYRNEDRRAMGILYKRYAHLVVGVCLKYLGDREAAKDATVDIFEQLMAKLKNQEIHNFKSWLYTLSKNHCLMQIRKEKVRPKKVNGVEVSSEADEFALALKHIKERRFELLEKAISSLKEEQRKSIELFYLKGKSYKQVMEETGADLKSVKSQIQNGKRNLKIILEQQHEFNERT